MWQRLFIGSSLLSLVLGVNALLQAGDAPDVVRVLHAWETASSGAAPLTDDELVSYAETHSAHEVEAAARLCGPIMARTLIQEFSWTATTTEGRLALTAVPRDPLVRAFYSGIEIELDDGTHLPVRLRFLDPAGERRATAIAVQQVSGEFRENPRTTGGGGEIRLAALIEIEDVDANDEEAVPDVTQVLADWQAASRAVERARVEFVRYEYDQIYGVEKRGSGRLYFESPQKGVYELQASPIGPGDVSRRTQPNGSAYALESDTSSLVFWDNRRVVVAYPDQHAYDEFVVPKQSSIQPAGSFTRLWYSLASPARLLPGVVGVHSDGFMERFEWSVLTGDDRKLILVGRPITDEDQLEISELQVILDTTTHLPQATRLIPPGGEREVVLVINTFVVNDDVPPGEWRPDLSGYHKYDSAPLAPPAEAEPAAE
ncbi:MAG: hypothetical protein JNG89_16855 [Planctomycetaceae bacterium]|nr:hypothetical protein [Planctomycetaceae bacterium]